MAELADKKCTACHGGEPPATREEKQLLLTDIPDWSIIEENGVEQLHREFTFENFKQALDFTDAVGAAAEDAGHHPVVTVTWGKAIVRWWTHAINGLHANDFIMAARTDRLFH